MSIHLLYPFIGTIIYLNYPKNLRINQTILYYMTLFHNIFLASFSGYIFLSLSSMLYSDGIVIQSHYYFQNHHFDCLIYLFYLSKYYEYIDTFILYLQGKNPIFLQKYHHIGAVICWHLAYYYKVDCIWLPSIFNAFVHMIMYSYYTMSLLKIKSIYRYKKYLTSLQIFQLVSISLTGPIMYIPPVETWFNYYIILIFQLYVCGLIYLFAQFSYNTYIVSKKVEKVEKVD